MSFLPKNFDENPNKVTTITKLNDEYLGISQNGQSVVIKTADLMTKANVGLSNVDNTSDINKPVSNAQQTEFDKKINITDIINDLVTGGSSKVLSAEQGKVLKGLVDGLGTSKVNVSDIIDNLNSDDINKPLSARQGKVLDEKKADNEIVNNNITNIEKQNEEIKSVKKTLNLMNSGNEEEQIVTGYDSVDYPVNVGNYGAKLNQKGLTVANSVNGKDIVNNGTVVFSSILNGTYYESLHQILITGTGNDITVTNDSGNVADITIIYLEQFFETIPTLDECKQIFPRYIPNELTSHEISGRYRSVSEDGLTTNDFFVKSDKKLGSVPSISDEVRYNNGSYELVQNTIERELQATEITELITISNICYGKLYTATLLNALPVTVRNNPQLVHSTFSRKDYINDISMIGNVFSWEVGSFFGFVYPLGTSLGEIQADLAGTKIRYQLAEPIITPLNTAGNLMSFSNGHTFKDFVLPSIKVYDTNITVDVPIKELLALYKVDKVTGERTELDLANVTLAIDGLSFTSTDLVKDDLIYFDYEFEPETPSGEMNISAVNTNSLFVVKDDTNEKFYKLIPHTENGVFTNFTTEEL